MALAVARATTPDLTFDHLVSLTTPLGSSSTPLGRRPGAITATAWTTSRAASW